MKNLAKKILEIVKPDVKVDENEKTFEITYDGVLLKKITESYYILRGYLQIGDETDYSLS